jgi:uncharacterized RDD family membrane protein YckC
MQRAARPINLEEERRKNTRIAIAIAAFGILCGILLYMAVFAVFFANPFMFLRLVPLPAFRSDAVFLDGKIVVLTAEFDFAGATYSKPPEERTLMRSFDGMTLSEPAEVEPYSSLDAADGRVYFFSEGLYRVFDGSGWEEHQDPGIGANPVGTVGPDGIWVLSDIDGEKTLKLIGGISSREVPLPFPCGEEGEAPCSRRPRLTWAEGGLNLFWTEGGTLLHDRLRGSSWRTEGRFAAPGAYRVVEAGGEMLLLTKDAGAEIESRSYEGGGWTAPRGLGVGAEEFNVSFLASEYDGKLAIVTQGFFSEDLYVIDEAGVSGRTSLKGPLEAGLSPRLLLLNAAAFAAFVLVVFVLSALVDRYKLGYWPLRRGRVRFASIFRRFLAHMADSLLISLPLSALGFLAFKSAFPPGDPFALFGAVVLGMLGFLLWAFLYYSLFEGLWGRTPGKWLCGIMVLRDDFVRCGLGRAFLRNLLRVVDAMFYYLVAVVAMGATLKWQRLGDIAAGTVVVRARRRKRR